MRLSLRSHTYWLCWFTLAFAPLAVEAAALERRERDGCELRGNVDLYGLGIRLGVYWQWVTCYLANRYVVEEISSALDANAIFLLALLIAMLRATLSHEHHNLLSESEVPDITLLDALVLLQLCYGYLFSVLSLFGYRTRLFGRAYISIVGTYIRLFLAGAISGYSVWFWFNGVEHLVQGECGSPVMFFFAKVHVLGGIKYFWKVVAIFCALYFCTVFLAGFLTFLVWVGALVYSAIVSKSGFRNEWSHFWDVTRSYATEEPKEAEGTKEEKRAFNFLSIINLFFIFWSVLSIELTINWNHMTGVTGAEGLRGTGQLIPALIGLGGFLRLVWIIIKNDMSRRAEKHKAAQPPLETNDSNIESQGNLSPISPTVQRAKTIAFQLNSKLLIYILSFGFIKASPPPSPRPNNTPQTNAPPQGLKKKKPTDAAESRHGNGNGETATTVPEKPAGRGPEVVEVPETGPLTGNVTSV